jgi:adenylate cyclase
MLINFVGPWERMKHYRFSDILRASEDRDEMEMWAEELGGKIAVVSEVLTGSSDIGPVPTDAFFPLSGVHANVINTILTESFLIEVPKARMLWVELFLLAGVLVLSLRFSSLAFSLGSAILVCAYIGAVSLSFLYGGIILHMLRPLLILALAITSILVYRYITEEKERAFIRATFGRYLSNEVVEELLGSPDGLKMSGEIREVTFLVSDLRGFTALSARLSPKEVIHILNRYLESMVEVIASYRGTVNEIEGDGILAFFGAPITAEDDTERAVACAIAMQNALLAVNEAFRAENLPELAMGIGVNRGEAVVGNIGSEKRAKYSAIGTPINTAYRIESYTVGGQVLISPNIHEKVRSIVKIRGTLEARFKGLERPVTLYDVQGIGGRYSITLPEKEAEVLREMEPPLAIHCFSLSGKVVSEAALPGRITHLGKSSARVSVEGKIEDRSNLKIRVAPEEAPGLSELYAKVVAADAVDGEPGRVNARVQFTWYPDDVEAFLEKKRAGNEH